MILRSLVASALFTGLVLAEDARAQVLLCPTTAPSDIDAADIAAEAERLLQRLTIALDLHGHRGIDEQAIMATHAETPSAFLAKLNNVASRCAQATGDLEGFYEALPDIRKVFLEATDMSKAIDINYAVENDQDGAGHSSEPDEAQRIEESIDLSIRELWRRLWFRSDEGGGESDNGRWAVIVASPSDADKGWDTLGNHQRQWKDAYFQLHEPYYDSNPHYAIVIGRRLPRDQAERLRDYAIELGMAEDSYLWELPADGAAVADTGISADQAAQHGAGEGRPELGLLEKRVTENLAD